MAEDHRAHLKTETDGNWLRCKGNCFQTIDGENKRCESYGHHEWCCNYMVNQDLPVPEFFESMQ